MPWSDWQDPLDDDDAKGPLKVALSRTDAVSYRAAPGDPEAQITEVRSALVDPDAPTITEVVSPFAVAPAVAQQQFNPFDPPAPSKALARGALSQRIEWYGMREGVDARPAFPVPLNDLEEGVDFTIRPDREGWERDAYIEWEDGQVFIQPRDVTGWASTVTATVGSATFEDGATNAQARVYEPSDWLPMPAEDVGENAATPVVPSYGSPSGVLGVNGTTGASSSTTLEHGPGTWQWQLVTEPRFEPFGISSGFYDAQFDLDVAARVFLRYPRWRYWIPEAARPKPLRQRQRDDGLGMSTARWRVGRSRQSSNRWRGYL